jgi:hypothetical protein
MYHSGCEDPLLIKSCAQLLRAFDFQLVSPIKPCDSLSYGVFCESNMLIKVTESI